MKKMLSTLFLVLAVPILSVLPAVAQTGPSGSNSQLSVPNIPQAEHRRQVAALLEEFKNAKSDEQRKEIHEKMRRIREQYRTASPAKELPPAEIEARRQKMEEMLKKDPFRWEMYQLRQTMGKAKTPEERESYHAKIQTLMAEHAAEAEAKLTPEQRAAAQARQIKNDQMRAEIKPLMEQLRAAKTYETRRAIRAQMTEIFKKYQ